MTIHSDSVYKDAQREIEAEKVDTKELSPTEIQAESSGGDTFLKFLDSTGYQMAHIEIDEDSTTQQGETMKIRMHGGDDRLFITNPSDQGLTVGDLEFHKHYMEINNEVTGENSHGIYGLTHVGVIDDAQFRLGADNDITFEYDSGNAKLKVAGSDFVDETNDGMTANPESATEEGFLTIEIGTNVYQIPLYSS